MSLVVFVTNEVHPFTAGGLGRVIANVLTTMSKDERERTHVLFVGSALRDDRWRSTYPDVGFTALEEGDRTQRGLPRSAFPNREIHFRSLRVLDALFEIERARGPLAYVEFPDWGAFGFAAIQEKRLGRAFCDTTLAVRLHSTTSVLAAHERAGTYGHLPYTYDLERKCLADCDLVIGQLPSVAAHARSFFSLERTGFDDRLRIHAPPVVVRTLAARTVTVSCDTPLVFSSKVQHFKRPGVFVRAAVGLLRARPDLTCEAYLVAHGADAEAGRSLRRLVPEDLAARFHFIGDATEDARNALIARSVCVVPSAYESFCLAAYEASLMGAHVVLNGANPAFDDASPFVEGVSCTKFDGTVSDLVRALLAVYGDAGTRSPVQPPRQTPPWLELPEPTAPPSAHGHPLVSVIVPHYELGAYLPRTLDSVRASTYANVEIVVVDDASRDAVSRAALVALVAQADPRIRVVQSTVNQGLAATRNHGLTHARGAYVLCLDADDLIAPTFIELAVNALERAPGYDFVVPQTAYFTDEQECSLRTREAFDAYTTFHGDAFATAFSENMFSTATCLARAHVLRALRYDESLESFEDWELYVRAASQGHRFLVTSGIEFFYRYRANSMVHAPEAAERYVHHIHDLRRSKRFSVGAFDVPAFVLPNFRYVPPEPPPFHDHPLVRLGRKARKLLRDPARFFAESENPRTRALEAAVEQVLGVARRKGRRDGNS